jgi:hypothetical protein
MRGKYEQRYWDKTHKRRPMLWEQYWWKLAVQVSGKHSLHRSIHFSYALMWTICWFIIFLSSITFIETCYGCYKTESFHLFKGLPKFLFPFDWYFIIIFGILSTCSFFRGSDASHTASPTQSSTSPSHGIPCFNWRGWRPSHSG